MSAPVPPWRLPGLKLGKPSWCKIWAPTALPTQARLISDPSSFPRLLESFSLRSSFSASVRPSHLLWPTNYAVFPDPAAGSTGLSWCRHRPSSCDDADFPAWNQQIKVFEDRLLDGKAPNIPISRTSRRRRDPGTHVV